jgi:putative DNA primase/helicase
VNRACSRSYSAANASSELARDKLDLPWGEEEVETAVYACFNAWLERRGGSGAGEIMDAILKLRAVIDAHGEARFLSLDQDEVVQPIIPVRDLLGYRFGKGGAVIWAFTESAWKETMQGVADLHVIEGVLYSRGIIQVTLSLLNKENRHRFAKKIDGRTRRLVAISAAELYDGGVGF